MARVDHSGDTLDERYHVDQLIGAGGMGRVYLGRHARVGRKVAIKILNAELAADADIVKRFFREARAAAAIGHRNIIDVLDVGVTASGEPYLVMEYLEGESLAALITRSAPVPLGAACGILEPVLQALGAAHAAGIVHRDLKPENIFLSYPDGQQVEPKLIDFGISKVTEDVQNTRLTDTGQLLGTPAYMAPEQAEDAVSVDARTDIYAIGIILYELLTGTLPFDASSNYKLLAQVLKGEIRPPEEANPDFPSEARPLLFKAMARDRTDRYPSAEALLSALRELSAWNERLERLAAVTEGLFGTTVAQGGLGASDAASADEQADAEAMLAAMVQNSTPSKVASGARDAREKEPPARWPWWIAGAAALIAAGVGVSFAIQRPEIPAIPSASAAAEQIVEIRVTGAPEGARILYEGALVPSNPFRAQRSVAVRPLIVEAPGHEPYAVSVVPDGDKVVEVTLKPLPAASATMAPASATAEPSATAAPPATTVVRPPIVAPPVKTGTAKKPGGFIGDTGEFGK